MANGVKALLKGHLKGIDLAKNASIQDLMIAAIVEVMDSINGKDGESGMKKDIEDLKEVKLGFFARLGAVKATVIIMIFLTINAIACTKGLIDLVQYLGSK